MPKRDDRFAMRQHLLCHHLQILVQRLSADPELTSNLCFTDTSREPLQEFLSCRLGQRLLSPTIGTSLFRQSNPFPLPLVDQGSFKLGKGTHDG